MNVYQQFVDMIRRRNYVILDTETTGLRYPAEIIELAIVDPDGQVLLNERVKPVGEVPADATRIHGIKASDLTDCRSWPEVRTDMIAIISGKDVVVYNASYDFGMFHNSDRVCDIHQGFFYDDVATFHCAMLWYANWYGDWDDYHLSYRWQKLTAACEQLGITVENAHGALGDCQMTRKVIEAVMALTE